LMVTAGFHQLSRRRPVVDPQDYNNPLLSKSLSLDQRLDTTISDL
jgi:hypothetical protein